MPACLPGESGLTVGGVRDENQLEIRGDETIMAKKPFLEHALESGLFASRWLMAPFYIGLVVALLALLASFVLELVHQVPHVLEMDPEMAILLALSLIDLSLAANLVLIVIFAGYENFVSKIDVAQHDDRPEWMGTVDFSGLKLKLIASIVAISGIALLKAFLRLGEHAVPFDVEAQRTLMWQVIVHITFVVSGVLLAFMDWLSGHQRSH
jgi:uncharacterized protein (TIGR00645 family)